MNITLQNTRPKVLGGALQKMAIPARPAPTERMSPFVWTWSGLRGPKGVQGGQTEKGWACFSFLHKKLLRM